MIKVGTYAMSGMQAAYAAWNATFDTYLTHELYSELNCTFRLVPLLNESAVYTAVSNSTIDLLYTNSGMHVCLEVKLLRQPSMPLTTNAQCRKCTCSVCSCLRSADAEPVLMLICSASSSIYCQCAAA